MIDVDNSCLEHMESPVRPVMAHMQEAIVRIAPEKLGQLRLSDFRIRYIDTGRWVCGVTEDGEVRISRFAVEAVWCSLYTYAEIYRNCFEGQAFSGVDAQIKIDWGGLRGTELMCWIRDRFHGNGKDGWPAGTPHPETGTTSDEIVVWASELCLASIACQVHHELGHISLKSWGHESIQAENEADLYAWNWVLEDVELGSWEHTKRLVGLCAGHLLNVSRTAWRGGDYLSSHPRAIDRLSSLLRYFGINENDRVYAFLVAIIQVQITESPFEMTATSKERETFFEAFEDLADHLAGFPEIPIAEQ